MNDLEKLNKGLPIVFRFTNGNRGEVNHVYGTGSLYSIELYYKGQRKPYYMRYVSHASEAITYLQGLNRAIRG